MVRPRHKILWPHKDRSPRTSGGEEKERRTDNAEEWTGKPFAETSIGTQPQQMEETAAQLVRTASRRLHGELKERGNSRRCLMDRSCLVSQGCHFIPFSYLLSGIPGLSFHSFFLSPVWTPGAVILYLFPISSLVFLPSPPLPLSISVSFWLVICSANDPFS